MLTFISFIALPGVIGFYYFGDSLYGEQDTTFPVLVKKVVPVYLIGFFAAVLMAFFAILTAPLMSNAPEGAVMIAGFFLKKVIDYDQNVNGAYD